MNTTKTNNRGFWLHRFVSTAHLKHSCASPTFINLSERLAQ